MSSATILNDTLMVKMLSVNILTQHIKDIEFNLVVLIDYREIIHQCFKACA